MFPPRAVGPLPSRQLPSPALAGGGSRSSARASAGRKPVERLPPRVGYAVNGTAGLAGGYTFTCPALSQSFSVAEGTPV